MHFIIIISSTKCLPHFTYTLIYYCILFELINSISLSPLVSSYPLSPMESHCIQWLVQCYTPVVASWLETEPEAFEVFLSLLSSTIPLSPTVPSLATLALNQVWRYTCTCTYLWECIHVHCMLVCTCTCTCWSECICVHLCVVKVHVANVYI